MEKYFEFGTNILDRNKFEEAYNIFYSGVDILGDPEDYSEINLIGKGSFGKVYQFKKKSGSGSIVVKVIKKIRESDKFVEQEISVLKKLRRVCSRYVLCYIGAFEDSKNYYILTEYLGDYITLYEYRERNYELTKQDKETIIQNLVLGLQLIHSNGIAHRDIKPDNIMINSQTLDIKYIDFGGGCDINPCVGSIYTKPYMAPELLGPFLKRPRTLKQWMDADLWSLAETIWEIIIGDPRQKVWTNYFDYYDGLMRSFPSSKWTAAEWRVYSLLANNKIRSLDRKTYIDNFLYSDPLVPDVESFYSAPLFIKSGEIYKFDLESLYSLNPTDRTYAKRLS